MTTKKSTPEKVETAEALPQVAPTPPNPVEPLGPVVDETVVVPDPIDTVVPEEAIVPIQPEGGDDTALEVLKPTAQKNMLDTVAQVTNPIV